MEQKNGRSTLFSVLFLFCCALSCYSCVKLPRYLGLPAPYRDFIARDQSYYAQLTQAFDRLHSQDDKVLDAHAEKIETRLGGKGWKFSGKNPWLPDIVRNLHASGFTIQKSKNPDDDGVSAMIGVTRPGYGIGWSRQNYGVANGSWVLQVFPESPGPLLYSSDPEVEKILNAKVMDFQKEQGTFDFLVLFVFACWVTGTYLVIRWKPNGRFKRIARLLMLALLGLIFCGGVLVILAFTSWLVPFS